MRVKVRKIINFIFFNSKPFYWNLIAPYFLGKFPVLRLITFLTSLEGKHSSVNSLSYIPKFYPGEVPLNLTHIPATVPTIFP